MAFFFLFTGLLVGASMVALTESERDYYYSNRDINMSYMGNKDGMDVYRDNITGQFYVDDGWEVSRIGKAGFTPHPVERLKQLCAKYNPSNSQWVDFLLASFEGREQQLWQNMFDKYELGPKPKEPTWGKNIRKARWSEYGRQVDEWEAKKNQLTPKFLEENRRWSEKRKMYDAQHQEEVSRAAGQALLRRALSGGATVIVNPLTPSNTTTYKATVPQGSKPGDTMMVNAGGQTMAVVVPPGAYPGKEITFQGPALQAQVVQAIPAPYVPAPVNPPPAYSAPPPAYSAPTPPAYSPPPPPAAVPPPAAAPPAALEKKSSMNW